MFTFQTFVSIIHVILCVFMIFVILLQPGKDAGRRPCIQTAANAAQTRESTRKSDRNRSMNEVLPPVRLHPSTARPIARRIQPNCARVRATRTQRGNSR